MARQPLFAGLVVDEYDQVAETAMVGDEPCYVVNDAGFRRHIPSADVDRQVLAYFQNLIAGHEDLVSEQTAKMLGQEDPFTRAVLTNQIEHIGDQFDALVETGLTEDARLYLGMIGFRVVINLHGDVLRIDQPAAPVGDGDEGGDE